MESSLKMKLPWWWYLAPAYLTLWSLAFSLWNFFDGTGMMTAFGIDVGNTPDFIMLNSAGRYVAIAIGMVVGIWVFRTYHSILTALAVRLSMDILDLIVGLQTGTITDATGVIQSFLMFLIPGGLSLFLLWRTYSRS